MPVKSHLDILGHTVTDRITKFRGVVTGYVYYMSGCNQVLIMPSVKKDGTAGEGHWFDVQRVAIDRKVTRIVLDNSATPGCDMPAPKR